jgi:hypothetical protein
MTDSQDLQSAVTRRARKRTHERTLESAMSHMDLGEHVTWMLGDVCDAVDYPQRVTVTIEVEEVDR